jgi:hypothetical protein
MGANPFITGVEPGGKVVIGNPVRGNPLAGSCYFKSHWDSLYDKIRANVNIGV